jgi:hypothetical protein
MNGEGHAYRETKARLTTPCKITLLLCTVRIAHAAIALDHGPDHGPITLLADANFPPGGTLVA